MVRFFKNLSGDTLVFASMLIFGSYALFIKPYKGIVPEFMFLFAMQAVGAVGFYFLSRCFGTKNLFTVFRGNVWLFLGLILVTLGNDWTYFAAMRLTSVANAAFTHQMVSAFLLFLAPIFLLESTTKKEWGAFAVSLIGLGVLFIPAFAFRNEQTMWGNFGGIGLGTFSAFFYAFLIICYRKLDARGLSIWDINFWRFSVSTIIMFPFVIHFGGIGIAQANFWTLIVFGLLFAVVASGMHNFAFVKTRALHISIIGKIEPLLAIGYAFFFLKETPAAPILVGIGGALILGSSVWLAFQKES